MLFLEYPKCSTCKKAKNFLDSKGADYEDRHIVENKSDSRGIKAMARNERT